MTIMSKLRELNNYIADVPMRFSDKYLSLQVNNNTLAEDVEGENFVKFKIDDYKFKAELVAIEMFELHHKKKLEQSLKNAASTPTPVANAESTKFSNSDNSAQHLGNSYFPNSHPSANQNNFLFNMISGEILQPQPLNKSASSSRPAAHSDCDKVLGTEIKSRQKLIENLVYPKEFENDDSSPFDNVELQTIDDIKELNNVFQALNTGTENNSEGKIKENGLPNTFHSDASHYSPSLPNGGISIKTPNHKQEANYNHSQNVITQLPTNGPYSQQQPSQLGFTNHSQHPVNSIAISSSYNGSPNSMPMYDPTLSYNSHFPMAYPQPCNSHESHFEMKRSSSEKKNISQANYDTAPVDHNTANSLRPSKSVSDLTNISKTASHSESRTSLHDRSRTPPASTANANQVNSKPISLSDPYQFLSESEKVFVNNLCQMGFKRDRVSRAVKHIDITDDKKIFEYLYALQLLEDQGYNCYETEVALHMNNYNKDRAETFLTALKQICEFGFDKEAAIKALFKSNNDRDKAIDLLLNSR